MYNGCKEGTGSQSNENLALRNLWTAPYNRINNNNLLLFGKFGKTIVMSTQYLNKLKFLLTIL